ncbi:protein kinase superfamily protein [Wolffia australiana]
MKDWDVEMGDLEEEGRSGKPPHQWKGILRLWRQKSMRRLATFPAVGVPRLPRRRPSKDARDGDGGAAADLELCLFKPSWKSFSLSELQLATRNFNPENLIGKGGYAEVYKGRLGDGRLVAVKKLIKGTSEEMTASFLAELGIITHTNHPNVAKLVGFSVDGAAMHIVLQLSPHGSLATFLFSNSEENSMEGGGQKLGWKARYNVALGTARGLEYLHERCQRRIIHRDIKAANILLADDFEPQICDFGLAKWLPEKWTHHTVSAFEGTFGYLAPEYSMHGIVDEKTDVYAFGVLLLELISGRKALDGRQRSLVMWARPLLQRNDLRMLTDPAIGDAADAVELRRVAYVAALCIQYSAIRRPRMSEVAKLLSTEGVGSAEGLSLRQRLLPHRTLSEELFETDDYSAGKYLRDLCRHKQLALDL